MSKSCMHNHNEECCNDCPECSRYVPEIYCENCGKQYHSGDKFYDMTETKMQPKYYCEDCLKYFVITKDGVIKHKDVLEVFLEEKEDTYQEWLEEFYSDLKYEGVAAYD